MASSSSGVRRIGTKQFSGITAGIGVLPIPDPRTWPEEIRAWFRKATGECAPLDVFIFNHGQVACLYLQDAITAAAVMEIDISEWHTERGYPVFVFDPGRIGEVQHQLGIVGYEVRVLEPVERQVQPGKRKSAKVLNIAVGRDKAKKAQS